MIKEPKNIKDVIEEMEQSLAKLEKEISILDKMYKQILLYKIQLEKINKK